MSDNLKKPRVLVVEDEERIASILLDYLKQSGFETDATFSGEGVVDSVRENPPDILLLDLMLPGVDGLTICREVRKFSELPIIMVTARVDELDRLLGLELGADDYICKPFSPREVVARVKAVLRRHSYSPEPVGDNRIFQIDEGALRISVNGERLELTPMEFRLLSKLIHNPGRVYSRAHLHELCTGPEQRSVDRTIDSHIKNLRKKIARYLPDREVIQSVYGVGYRFEI